MAKLSKIARDEKPSLRKPIIKHDFSKSSMRTRRLVTREQPKGEINSNNKSAENSKKILLTTALSHQIKMAKKVRAKYQRLLAVTTAVAGFNPKKEKKSTTVASAAPVGADLESAFIHDTDMDDLVAMFSKLRITDTDAINEKETTNPLPNYGSRQNIDVNAQEQIGCVLQQIRLEMAVSQQLSQSLGSASLTGSSRRRKRSACDDNDDDDDSGRDLLSDEEYLMKRRKFSNKERNFA